MNQLRKSVQEPSVIHITTRLVPSHTCCVDLAVHAQGFSPSFCFLTRLSLWIYLDTSKDAETDENIKVGEGEVLDADVLSIVVE